MRVARQALSTGRDLIAARTRGERVPLLVGAAVTHACDGSCIYCRRAGASGDDLDTGTWIELLAQMAAAGTRRVSLTGGEPLVRPDVGRLLHEARALGLVVNLNTNGLRLARRLEEVVRADSLTVSFDGPRDVTEALRGGGSYNRVVKGVRAAVAAGVPTSLHATLTRTNVGRVDELLDEASGLGVRISFAPLRSVPLGHGGDADLYPGREEMRAAVDLLIRRKLAGRTAVLNSLPCLRHLRRWPEPTPIRCAAGTIYARLEPDGTLFACGDEVLSGRGVSVLEGGFAAAFRSLGTSGCDECWCDTRVEMNKVWALDPVAVVEAVMR